MPHLSTALLFAPVFLTLVCLQLLSGCIFMPVDDGRGRGGHDRGGYGRDRYDDHRR